MEKEIQNFYDSRNYQIQKMVDRCPNKKLTKDQIIGGAIKLYKEIELGREVREIAIPREVWRLAEEIDSEAFLAGYGAEIEGKYRDRLDYFIEKDRRLKTRQIIWISLFVLWLGIEYKNILFNLLDTIYGYFMA